MYMQNTTSFSIAQNTYTIKSQRRTKTFDILAETERDTRGTAQQADNQVLKLFDHHTPQSLGFLLFQFIGTILCQTLGRFLARQAL
jgi:hypothetical protein